MIDAIYEQISPPDPKKLEVVSRPPDLGVALAVIADVLERERDDAARCVSPKHDLPGQAGNLAAALVFSGLAKSLRKALEAIQAAPGTSTPGDT